MSAASSAPAFTTIAEGLAFPEAPRWHDGALWFSDMHARTVHRVVPGGAVEGMFEVPESPSGLGFLPDGSVLVVSMHDRRVLRFADGELTEHADLSTLASWHLNDMLVDAAGRAYVTNFGDASWPPEPITPGALALVHPDGTIGIAAEGMHFANGMALTDGGTRLVVAETRALPPRITQFDVAPDGGLTNRRLLVELEAELPDGLTADTDGNIWFASPFTSEVIKVSRDGEIITRVVTPVAPYACALGGDDLGTLFVCAAGSWHEDQTVVARDGVVLAMDLGGSRG